MTIRERLYKVNGTLKKLNNNFEKNKLDSSEYVFLIGEWAKNPNLTENQLAGLIRSNHFDSRYGVTVADVVSDIRKYKKDPTYKPITESTDNSDFVSVPNSKPTPKPVINIIDGSNEKALQDSTYVFLIGEWSKNPNLTEDQLAGLIRSNHFDSKYGITVADVKNDINIYKANNSTKSNTRSKRTTNKSDEHTDISESNSIVNIFKNRKEYVIGLKKYMQKYKDTSFLDENIEKFAKESGISLSADNILSIRRDLLQLQMDKKPSSPLFLSYIEEIKVDSGFKKAFSERVGRYMHLANEYTKFRGILLDLLPEYKREVNMLSQLLTIGIVEDLQQKKEADSFLENRYIKRMSDDYGYDEVLISEIVSVWCEKYLDYLNN